MKLLGNELSRGQTVLLITAPLAVILVVIGIASGDVGVLGNLAIFATFMIITPYLLLQYEKFRDIKNMEEKFPILLRDVVELMRSGMPLHKAIISSARLNYGKLNPEIKKMSNQLSWGMTVDKVLDQFGFRVSKSRRISSAVKVIRESYLSGGDVVATLDSVADNVLSLTESEKEKKSTLSQYVVMMYAVSFVFLGIVVVINKLLIPIFQVTEAAQVTEITQIGLSNPCLDCFGMTCNICGFFEGTAQSLFSIEPGKVAAYYTPLFFFMAIVQSLFSGLIAGQISEGSFVAGLKHSVILVGITFGAFLILARLGILVG